MAVTGPLAAEVRAILPKMGKRAPEFFSGAYGAELTREEALSAFRNMMRGRREKRQILSRRGIHPRKIGLPAA
jgi:hypothetical protein